jgi:hypothetical protein
MWFTVNGTRRDADTPTAKVDRALDADRTMRADTFERRQAGHLRVGLLRLRLLASTANCDRLAEHPRMGCRAMSYATSNA